MIKAKLDELRPITLQAANLQQIGECQQAADGYQPAMNGLLQNWLFRDDLAKKRAAVATLVLTEAQNTVALGLKDTGTDAIKFAQDLSSTTYILLGGLLFAAIAGISIAVSMTPLDHQAHPDGGGEPRERRRTGVLGRRLGLEPQPVPRGRRQRAGGLPGGNQFLPGRTGPHDPAQHRQFPKDERPRQAGPHGDRNRRD